MTGELVTGEKRGAIVTGGSSGLGLAIAEKLGLEGYAIALVARDPVRCADAQHLLNRHGIDARAFACDVADEKAVREVVAQVNRTMALQVLVNAAGIGRFGPVEEARAETITDVFRGNLIGTIIVCSAVLPLFRRKGTGTIATVLSTAALTGRPNESVYCAAKWGARGYMEALRAATKGSGVRVVSIYPGGIKTPFWSADCGMKPDVDKFMDPVSVAATIVTALLDSSSGYVTEMTISRG